jgi:hypothetical protein
MLNYAPLNRKAQAVVGATAKGQLDDLTIDSIAHATVLEHLASDQRWSIELRARSRTIDALRRLKRERDLLVSMTVVSGGDESDRPSDYADPTSDHSTQRDAERAATRFAAQVRDACQGKIRAYWDHVWTHCTEGSPVERLAQMRDAVFLREAAVHDCALLWEAVAPLFATKAAWYQLTKRLRAIWEVEQGGFQGECRPRLAACPHWARVEAAAAFAPYTSAPYTR